MLAMFIVVTVEEKEPNRDADKIFVCEWLVLLTLDLRSRSSKALGPERTPVNQRERRQFSYLYIDVKKIASTLSQFSQVVDLNHECLSIAKARATTAAKSQPLTLYH